MQSEHTNGFLAKFKILNINWSKRIMRRTIDQSYAGQKTRNYRPSDSLSAGDWQRFEEGSFPFGVQISINQSIQIYLNTVKSSVHG
jgi:hypothetical protein